MRVRLRVLGPLEVDGDDGPVEVIGPKRRALLIALALRPGQVVSLHALVDLLWGETPPRTAHNTIQAHVSQLRRVMPGLIVTMGTGYRLDVPPEVVDAAQFVARAADGRRAAEAGNPSDAAAALGEALGLWRADALDEWGESLAARAEASRFAELRLATWEDRVDAELALSHHPMLVGELEAMVRAHPFRERLWGQLVLALYRCGRQADALRAYQRARTVLAEELGVEPSAALRRLDEQVIAQDAALDVVPPPPPVTVALGAPDETDLVGRERELAQLVEALGQAQRSCGSLFLVSGEPGIGKTRLAEELASQARVRGVAVTWGSTWEGRGAPAYWPWTQALRSLVDSFPGDSLDDACYGAGPELAALVSGGPPGMPEVGPPVGDDDDVRFALFDAVARFLGVLARSSQGLLVVLDDVHAADRPTLLLLAFMARRLRDLPVVVATARTAELRLTPELGALVADAARFGRRILLAGLDAGSVGRIVERAWGEPPTRAVAESVWSATEGNPFFVGELAQMMAFEGDRLALPDAIPSGVRDTVRQRLALLSSATGEALALAAVVGREFSLVAVERAWRDSGTVLQLLAQAVAGGVISREAARPDRFRFAHALVRETVYDDMGDARRAGLHLRIGEALESLALVGDVSAAELAHHFVAAVGVGGASRALTYSVEAARVAMAQAGFEDAAAHYQRALDALPYLPESVRGRRIDLLLGLADASEGSGRGLGGEAALTAAQLAREVGDAQRFAEAALRAPFGGDGGQPAVGLLESALEGAGEAATPLRAKLGEPAIARHKPYRGRRAEPSPDTLAPGARRRPGVRRCRGVGAVRARGAPADAEGGARRAARARRRARAGGCRGGLGARFAQRLPVPGLRPP